MKIFQPGEKYELIFSAYPRAGSVAGSVAILSVDRVPESEMQFLECGSKESFYAHCGEISFIIHSKSASKKIKKAVLLRGRDSKEWAETYHDGETEYEWFSPAKRSYNPIFSINGQL